MLRVDEKFLREYSILNCCGVIITTNYKDAIYLPADDRRHYITWSECTKEDFPAGYWSRLWGWYEDGGDHHVAAFLARLDISSFNSKAAPPKTPAFWAVVDAGRAPEDAELADVLEQMKHPDAVTLARLTTTAEGGFQDWLMDRRNRRIIPHRLETCGYTPVRNNDAINGLWVVHGKRQVIYAKMGLSIRDRLAAASALVAERDPF